MNNISKKLKFQINKKLIKNNGNTLENGLNLKDNNLELKDKILFDLFKSLIDSNFNYETIEKNKFSKIINDIYSNYLYLNNNFKAQNQRVLSNANSLFESLCIYYLITYIIFNKYII